MKLEDVKNFCKVFYKRFSVLDLRPFQLKFEEYVDCVSISLEKKNLYEDAASILVIDTKTVRILKINSFEDINTRFVYDTPLELYTNLLTLMLLCCNASHVFISPMEALNATLGKKLKSWRELVVYICSLSPEKITVFENKQNALKFLKTTFCMQSNVFTSEGLFWNQVQCNDVLEMIRAVLDAISGVFKIYDYVVDPFPLKIRDMHRLS